MGPIPLCGGLLGLFGLFPFFALCSVVRLRCGLAWQRDGEHVRFIARLAERVGCCSSLVFAREAFGVLPVEELEKLGSSKRASPRSEVLFVGF